MRHHALRVVPVLALALAMLLVASTAAFGAGQTLALYGVHPAEYPTTVARVGLPDGLIEASGTPTFTVAENGTPVEVLSAKLARDGGANDVALVVDCSGSMAGRPLADAKAAAHRFVNEVAGPVRIALISFDSAPHVVTRYTADTTALNAAIDGLVASGETASYDAIVQAVRLPHDGQARAGTVVLLADGADDSSVASLDDAVKAARAASTPVITLALASPDLNEHTLATLAEKSGGRLVPVADSAKLSDLFASVAREVTSVYEVTYRSSRPTTKNIDLDITAATPRGTAAVSTTVENPLYLTEVPVGTGTVAVPTSNPWMLFGCAVLAFGSVGLLVPTVLTMGGRGVRLDQMRFYDQLQDVPDQMQEVRGSTALRRKVIDAVGVVAGRGGFTQTIHAELERAGLPLRPAEYIAAHVTGVALSGFLCQLVLGDLRISMAVILFASAAPLLYLRSRGRKRTRDFEAQLPDVLNLLSGGLRTGWGLQQAIDLVVTEGEAPASEEFRRAQIESRLGVPVETSLEAIAERLDSDAFRWVVSAVSIQREVGGNLAEVLDNVATSVRDRDSLQRHVSALTAEGRFSAIILTALPFLVAGGIFVVAPDYIKTGLASPLGVPLVVLALILLVIGLIWLRAVSRIEY